MSVEIRKYASQQAFAADATQMAAASWNVIAQTQGSRVSGAGQWCAALGILLVIAGLVILFPLIVIGVILIVIAAFSRTATYTVTYQYTAKPPVAEANGG